MQTSDSYCPANRAEWRAWLLNNHEAKPSVWLVLHKKASGKPTISWGEAVDEALCFGWVDGRRKLLDADSFIQFFCKRKPRGTWSKINKEKVALLTEKQLMQPAGVAAITIAQQNGSWDSLNEVEAYFVPEDLRQALQKKADAETYFDGLSKSTTKAMLQWINAAKRPETRTNRINEIAELAVQKRKPKQF